MNDIETFIQAPPDCPTKNAVALTATGEKKSIAALEY
jgi:hypothetical protein